MTLASRVLVMSVGLVFLVAVIGKIRHPLAFADAVRNYQILPDATALWVAIFLVAIECFLATAFLAGWLIEVAIPTAVATLLTFAVAVGLNLHRNRPVVCGCFGDPQEPISGRTMTRLMVLLIGVCLIWIIEVGQGAAHYTMWFATRDARYGLEVLTLAVGVNLLGMWFLAVPQLKSIVRVAVSGVRQSDASTARSAGEGK